MLYLSWLHINKHCKSRTYHLCASKIEYFIEIKKKFGLIFRHERLVQTDLWFCWIKSSEIIDSYIILVNSCRIIGMAVAHHPFTDRRWGDDYVAGWFCNPGIFWPASGFRWRTEVLYLPWKRRKPAFSSWVWIESFQCLTKEFLLLPLHLHLLVSSAICRTLSFFQ